MLTNICIKKETRKKLRYIGRKEQTYDDIINELIRKIQDPQNANFSKSTFSGSKVL